MSDRKFGVSSAGSSLIDHYDPHIVTAQDYYPFGMLSRVALPGNDKSYAFGFNGKMNDNDVKGGLGNQQDYGMRIYDPRIGKFLSIDPLTKDYPELTPYQFASNRPIDGVDLDGAEYLKPIPKFEYSGNNTWQDYVSAIDNGAIDMLNLVPTTWNSIVSTTQSIKRGTYAQDLKNDAKQFGANIKQGASKFIKAPLTTLASPEGVEFITNAFIGAKIFSPVKSTGNLMKPITAEAAGAETQAAANSAKAVNVKKPFGNGYEGMEFLDDNLRMVEQPYVSPGALAAARYPGVAADYATKTATQLQKSIRSTMKTIQEHEGYIKNPLSKKGLTQESWDAMSTQAKEGLLKKWQKDIDRNSAYLEIAKEALRSKQ